MSAMRLRTPEEIRVRLAAVSPERRAGAAAIAADVVARGLLIGIGAGLVLMAGSHADVASVTVLGVLALGAALVGWDR